MLSTVETSLGQFRALGLVLPFKVWDLQAFDSCRKEFKSGVRRKASVIQAEREARIWVQPLPAVKGTKVDI